MRDQANDGNDPILVFKQQSHEQPSDIDDMSKNDFLIGIKTSFQRDMLVRFGPTAICMYSTHSTKAYDFFLTILVLDDLSERIPIAWIISNREDAENFLNAWRAVFTVKNTRKLICAWHIDKSWRRGIQSHISSRTKQIEVYHHLRIFLKRS